MNSQPLYNNIMIKLFVSFVALLLSASLSTTEAQWKEHYQWKSCTFAGFYGNYPFAGYNMGLFGIEDNAINMICKSTFLSDCNITSIYCNDTYIYIGYNNGNIDILNMDDCSTYNIPELKLTETIVNKKINSFTLHNNTLYCGTQSGIYVVDIAKKEFKTQYKVSEQTENINAITLTNDSIYAATSNGLFSASRDCNLLEDNRNWNIAYNITSECSDVETIGNNIIIAVGKKGATNSIYYTQPGTSPLTLLNSSANFREFSKSADALSIVCTNKITTLNASLATTHTLTSYSVNGEAKKVNIRSAYIKDGVFAIADGALGLVTCTLKGENATSHTLNGPSNNNCYKTIATKNGVYVVGGGLTSDYNNKSITPTLHTYINDTWSTSTAAGRDAVNICYDPQNHDSIYVSTWGSGIYKIEDHKFSSRYHAQNSSLIDIFGGNSYVRVNAICYDNESNLIVSNASVNPGLWIKTPENTWHPLSYVPTNACHSTKDMICTRNNNFWLIIPRTNYYGLFVFNTNGTIDDDTDDVYRAKMTLEPDERNYEDLLLYDSDGNILTSNVYAIAEDKTGTIWIGTDIGILAFYDDKTLFETPRPIFNRIKVPRNDGTNSADYLLDGVEVTSIAVDGANNKWIGTKQEGVFLINETGLKTLLQFNVNNSPLPTNEINSISIHPETGEVFIATPLGLLSYKNNISEPSNALTDITAYPNPIRPEFNDIVKFKGFTHDCTVKITDITGKLVYETKSLGGIATWNRECFTGSLKSGIYLIWATDKDGMESVVTKVLLMK